MSNLFLCVVYFISNGASNLVFITTLKTWIQLIIESVTVFLWYKNYLESKARIAIANRMLGKVKKSDAQQLSACLARHITKFALSFLQCFIYIASFKCIKQFIKPLILWDKLTVIHFLTTRNISAADINQQISEMYGSNAMSDSKVRTSGWELSMINPNQADHQILSTAVDEKLCEDWWFTVSILSLQFPNVGRVTFGQSCPWKLRFRKLYTHCIPRLLTGELQMKMMACALDFLEQNHMEVY